jgi:hypothetical protein
MKKRCIILFLVIFLIKSTLYAAVPSIHYSIINISGTDIRYTLKFKPFSEPLRVCYNNEYYNPNDTAIRDILGYYSPDNNYFYIGSHSDANRKLLAGNFNDRINYDYFLIVEPPKKITTSGIFLSLVDEFFVYDVDDNIVMTINDINDNSFQNYIPIDDWDGFILADFCLVITQEKISEGRKRYNNQFIKNENNKLTYITSVNLRIREYPSTNAPIVTILERGTNVQIMKLGNETNIDSIIAPWVQIISSNGVAGWCFAGYLEPFVQ